MASKSMKPSAPARPAAHTQEEKEQAALRQFIQKREQFAFTAMVNIARCDGMKRNPEEVAAWSVDAADALLKKLYSKSEEGAENEK